jgi:aminoglycoside/choline kinase family phosphotransferase
LSTRPIPPELLPWAMSCLGATCDGAPAQLAVVAGDASSRRYFRLEYGGDSYIVAEAPPATEKNEAFLAVRELLAAAGVTVPTLRGADLARGYLLLQDMGDRLLLPELSATSVDGHYQTAYAVLRRMAALQAQTLELPAYDEALLTEELSRFSQWFVEALLAYAPSAQEQDLIARFCQKLVDSALEQPQVLVHRDFHSRNLMLLPDGQLAVIDFQDAVVGPVTYDLVSLLRDCYIQWPSQQVCSWALAYRDELCAMGLMESVDDERFLRWFDWMGLQRHIKVLGTFARLYLRDGKSAYLDDLPLVIRYVREILEKYALQEPLFAEFGQWFERSLSPLIAAQHWSDAR